MKPGIGPQLYFGTFYFIGFMAILYVIFFDTIIMDETQKNMAMILLGILSGGLGQIMNFLFGSSAGSKAKSDQMSITK